MKIAVSNIAWNTPQDEMAVELMHRHGITGIEIAPTKIWNSPVSISEKDIRLYSRYWIDKAITPVAIQSVLFNKPEFTIFKDKNSRLKTLSYLKAMIRVCALLEAKIVVFGSPKNRLTYGQDREDIMVIAESFFRALGIFSQENGVYFCIEPNARAYGCDFLTNTDEAVEFVKRVDHPNVGLNLDTGIMILNQEVYEQSLAKALPFLRHLHVSEPFLEPVRGVGNHHLAVSSALRNVGYSGWVSLEMKNTDTEVGMALLDESLRVVMTFYQ